MVPVCGPTAEESADERKRSKWLWVGLGLLAAVVAAVVIGLPWLNPPWFQDRHDAIEGVSTLALVLLTGLAFWQTRASAREQVDAARAATTREVAAATDQLGVARDAANAQVAALKDQVLAIRQTATDQIAAQREIAMANGERERIASAAQIAAAERQVAVAERQAKDATERAERLQRAGLRTELLVELTYDRDGKGYPVLRSAHGDLVHTSETASSLRFRLQDDSMQMIEFVIENLGPGLMRDLRQTFVPMGLLTVTGQFRFDYIVPQATPFSMTLRPRQAITCRLWVSVFALLSVGQTREERDTQPGGTWRELGIIEHRWRDSAGDRLSDRQMVVYRAAEARDAELRLRQLEADASWNTVRSTLAINQSPVAPGNDDPHDDP